MATSDEEAWVKGAWAFKGADETELTFEAGAVIKVLTKPHQDWWSGTCDGRTGLFPSNYAKPLSSGEPATVLYDFTAGNPLDLPKMARGETIQVLEKPGTGWWLGRLASGEMGLLPSNYVRLRSLPSTQSVARTEGPSAAPVAASGGGGGGAAVAAAAASEGGGAPVEEPTKIAVVKSLDDFDALMQKGLVVELEAKTGTAPVVSSGQVVEVHCIAMTWNGSEGRRAIFGTTRGAKSQPLRFVVGAGHVTKGLQTGVLEMSVRQRATITCAPCCAYGQEGMSPIVPPNAHVIYHVEVLSAGPLKGGVAVPAGPVELLGAGSPTTITGGSRVSTRGGGGGGFQAIGEDEEEEGGVTDEMLAAGAASMGM